jgi:hypothetical protein
MAAIPAVYGKPPAKGEVYAEYIQELARQGFDPELHSHMRFSPLYRLQHYARKKAMMHLLREKIMQRQLAFERDAAKVEHSQPSGQRFVPALVQGP